MGLGSKHKNGLETMYIYLISDPRTNTPLYIGQAKCVLTRLGQHLAISNPKHNLSFYLILNELKRLMILPKVEILEVTNRAAVSVREQFYVDHYCKLYPTMHNKCLRPDVSRKTLNVRRKQQQVMTTRYEQSHN